MMEKKGQITLFIIIAIILLFSAALVLFIRERIMQVPQAQIGRMVEEVPVQFQPVQQYVVQCIDQVGRDAIRRVGAHGGYIGTREDDFEYSGRTFRIDPLGDNPTSSDVLSFSPDWHIPYWWHMSTPNTCRDDCAFESLMPTLRKENDPQGSVEAQMERYIQAHIDECLGNFRPFRQQGITITPAGTPRAYVTIARDDLLVSLDYPLEIEADGSAQEVRFFSRIFDVNLEKMFDLAQHIVRVESQEQFLEHDVLNLIAAYQGYTTEELPPMAGAQMGQFVATRWLRTNVQQQLQDIISQHSEAIQVLNTRNYNYISFGDGLRNLRRSSLYSKKTIWLNTTKLFWDYDVNVQYLPQWPIYFYISPGEIITARDGGAPFISIAPIPYQRYDLPYDVSVPYLFEVRDPYALNNEGFSLYFALESNVRNNLPLRTDSFMIMNPTTTGRPQLCDPEQRISGTYTITARDGRGQPVPEALIQLAASAQGCPIGRTDARGRWRGKFPTGVMGQLIVSKPGYSTHIEEYFMPGLENADKEVTLSKAVNVSIIGAKRNVNKIIVAYEDDGDPVYDWVFNPGPLPLMDNEQIIVMLERARGHPREQPFAGTVRLTGSEVGSMELIPGNYTANVILLKKGTDIVIPAQGDVPEIRLAPSGDPQEIPEGTDISAWEDEARRSAAPDNEIAQQFQEDAEAIWDDPESGVHEFYEENYVDQGFPTGMYELQVGIGGEIYSPLMDDMALRFFAINWNIVAVPESNRRVEDMEAYGALQEYVTNNSEVFGPVLARR